MKLVVHPASASASSGRRGSAVPHGNSGQISSGRVAAAVLGMYILGYCLSYTALEVVFKPGSRMRQEIEHAANASKQLAAHNQLHWSMRSSKQEVSKWPGDSIHSVVTSSGDPYQNFQTRIMYATYQIVQNGPGGDKLTGFTRILHRSVPDVLIRLVGVQNVDVNPLFDKIPTFHAWDVLKPQCDGWCDYPVANRPPAIHQWVDAVKATPSMITGAWVLMLECDYVWMRPVQAPGNAYDLSIPGEQFHYDYIIPDHPDARKAMNKLYPGGNVSDIPPSGPAPVIIRMSEWALITPTFKERSAVMEADEDMKKQLSWVREMYAWDVAVAMHKDKVTIRTQKPPGSPLIVQPPFDEGLGNGSLCHYTWGALYHEGGSTKGKQIYRWEKRDFNDMKTVIDVPAIPMPPPYRDGLTLEFEAPLTLPRHNLVVLMLTQMNKAIATLPNIQAELDWLNNEEMPRFVKWKEAIFAERSKKAAAAATGALASVKT